MCDSLQPHELQHARLPYPWTISQSLLRLMPTESVMPTDHLILSPSSLPAFCLFSIRVFSSESVLRIMRPKYWSLSFSISPSREYSGLISFRIDWFDLFAVQGTLRSLLQHHSSEASILQCSAFFMVQLSNPLHEYWKNHSFDYMDLCQWSDVCFLNRFIIAFPLRTKHLLISWLQLLSSVTLKPNKIKSVTVSTFSPSTWILTLGQALSYCCKHHLISSFKQPHNVTHFTSKAAEGIKSSQN